MARSREPRPVSAQLIDLSQALAGRLDAVAEQASAEAGASAVHLRDFLPEVLRAVAAGSRMESAALDGRRSAGRDAAREGVAMARLVDLHLSAAWRLASEAVDAHEGIVSPEALNLALVTMARAADDGVAAVCEGYDAAQHLSLRMLEAQRREFVDDLLSGTGSPDALEQHARSFGFNLSASHRVLVARTTRDLIDAGPVQRSVERELIARLGASDLVIATKEGALVCVVPSTGPDPAPLLLKLLRGQEDHDWRLAGGTAAAGPSGVARSYLEAEEALDLAQRLGFEDDFHSVSSLAAYRLLTRDPEALRDLAQELLSSLAPARGGPQPLLDTLSAYFSCGCNVTATARALHLSPRAVSYRLAAVRRLTGRRPQEARDRFELEVALLATRLTSH